MVTSAPRVSTAGGHLCPLRGYTTEYAELRIPSDPSNAFYAEFGQTTWMESQHLPAAVRAEYAHNVRMDWMPWENHQAAVGRR